MCDDMIMGFRDIQCRTRYIDGYIRQEIATLFFDSSRTSNLSKQQKKVFKALQKYKSSILSAPAVLLSVIDNDCASTEYATLAVNLVSNAYAAKLQSASTSDRTNLILEIADFSAQASDVLEKRLLNVEDIVSRKQLSVKILESRRVALNFWFEAAQVSYVLVWCRKCYFELDILSGF